MERTLLIADDEEVVRNGIYKYIHLHTDRFEKIYTAENGQQAIDQIVLHRPEIMLLDVRMPLKSGVEVMKESKRMGIMPTTVVLSGYDEFKYAQEALRCGAREYLLKPVRSSDILALLHQLADELFGAEQEEIFPEDTGTPIAIKRAEQYIKEHYNENLTAQIVADYAGISAGYLSTLFAQNRDYGFSDLLNHVRIERACVYLEQGYLKNYEVAYKVGYNDEKYFSRTFKKLKGISPAEYKKNYKNEKYS